MDKVKHAFGNSADIEKALQDGKINARDVLFLDENTDNPKVGWVTKSGEVVIATPDISGIEAELETKANAADVKSLENQITTKVDAAAVQSMISEATKNAIEVVEF